MAQEKWRLEGDYFESCNCTVLCPCLLSRAQERPTEGHCDVVMAFQVKNGVYGEIDLAGLRTAIAIYTPGPMAQGEWKLAVYVDDRADRAQAAALEAIFSGEAGGPPAHVAKMTSTRVPAKAAHLDFVLEGDSRRLSIPGVAEMSIEGIRGRGGKAIWFDNVFHFANRKLSAARSSTSRFKDGPFNFDNSGRNGHFAPINWSNE
ncbi:MAG: DUF1326 domain-containing protein [Candidatus Binataceae bacterium]